MRRLLAIMLVLLLSVSVLSACGGGPVTADDTRVSVVSTGFPGYDFSRAIAGDHIQLKMLLPPGAESHSYEPTPQDIIAVQNCDVFIYGGGESDAWVDGILSSMDTSGMKIITMMDYVELVEEEIKEGMEDDEHEHAEEEGHEDEHAEEEGHAHDEGEIVYDEHVWTNPRNAALISDAILNSLCELDDGNAEAYRANADAFQQELTALDTSFRDITAAAARHTIIFGDRFPFRYFVDAYGLDYFAAFPGCSTDTEPSAKTVAFLIDKVNAESIPAVFHIEFSNERMADTISESTGAKKLLLHSCHNVTKADFESGLTYIDLMKNNLETLREALN